MRYNIYYTDDDADDREMFIDAVNDIAEDVKVTTQGSGNELIEVLTNKPTVPDVIFLDLNMPIRNGYDVLKEIRNSDKIKYLPVVVFTTSDHDIAIETTRKLGASLYVPKPSTYNSLKSILKYVISIDWETFSPSEKEFVYRVN